MAPVWSSIFTGGYVNFASPDAYYQMGCVAKYYAAFPHLPISGNFYHIFAAGAAWLFSAGHGSISFLEHFACFIPVTLFITSAVMVYFVGKEIFSPRAGLIAVFAFALLPGEYLGRSILGEIDYHAFEVFLSTGAILCAVRFVKQPRSLKSLLNLTLLALLFYLYNRTWPSGSLIILPVLASFAFYKNWKYGILFLTLAAALFIPATYMILKSNLLTMATTAEAQSGFTGLFSSVHIIIASLLLIPKLGDKFRWPLFSWTLVFTLATIIMRRFDYYLIVPLSILLGGWLVTLKQSAARIAIAGIVFIGCLPGYVLYQKPMVPSPAWHEALNWVRENTPEDAVILSWWDYGYWINYISGRVAYVTPSQEAARIKMVAKWLLNSPPDERARPPVTDGVYIIISEQMVSENYLEAIRIWADDKESAAPLITRLFGGDIEGYRLDYANDEIKVYEVRNVQEAR